MTADMHEHMRRCLVRQLIRWWVAGDRKAWSELERHPNFSALKAEAERQWKAGNRGEDGKWID